MPTALHASSSSLCVTLCFLCQVAGCASKFIVSSRKTALPSHVVGSLPIHFGNHYMGKASMILLYYQGTSKSAGQSTIDSQSAEPRAASCSSLHCFMWDDDFHGLCMIGMAWQSCTHFLKTSAAIGTVELTGFEMMATQALGQYLEMPSQSPCTMPAVQQNMMLLSWN